MEQMVITDSNSISCSFMGIREGLQRPKVGSFDFLVGHVARIRISDICLPLAETLVVISLSFNGT
jgi:hypothetical protein